MSEIDWDRFPRATHHTPSRHGVFEGFWRKEGNEWVECWIVESGSNFSYYGKNSGPSCEKSITARPSTAWSGEGLPPVGVECEYQDSFDDWHKVEITGHSKLGVCFVADGCSGENYVKKESKFRPIRTPEQIAADERAAAFHTAICDVEEKVAKWNTTIDCSAAIKATVDIMIAMGYRK